MSDTAGVPFPPPLLYGAGFALGYGAHRLLPIGRWTERGGALAAVGWILLVGGVLLAVTAAYLFRRAGTTPNPTKPTTALVIRGPYRFTRNPMYLGMTALYLGGTVLLGDPWPLALLPVVLILLQRRVIAREEAYLERKFGDEYRTYKMRVRRWL